MNDSLPPELRAGSTLGRYELLLPIAKGGMAQVWAARLRGSRGFQKLVAIKTILAGVIDNTRMEQMFLAEAQLASQIHHPNVVGTLDLGEHEGVLYLVMEWVDGEPLHNVMSKAAASGGVPLAIGVNLIGQACQGLHAAHDLTDESGALVGLVHRDVSPQNVLVTYSGTAKLVDFGIAKATSKVSGLTEAGEVKGKFAYMSPEQVRGHALDRRTDLFALGILLYSITTGRHPFRGNHPAETVQNICADRPPTPPSAFLSDYPPALEQVVLKSLAKDPEQRYRSAHEMLTALEEATPEPLEASFESEVAEYLKGLFGARASERRAAIRVAQENADRQRTESLSSISVGTLRAISIEQHDSGSLSIRSTPQPLSATQQSAGASSLRERLTKPALIAGGSLLLMGVAFSLGGGLSPSASERSASASSPVPAISLEQLPSAVGSVAAPVKTASPHSEPDDAAADEEHLEGSDKQSGKERKAGKAARRIVVAPPPAPVPAAPPAPLPATPPSAAPAAAPASTPSTNAWDRGAFGGRH